PSPVRLGPAQTSGSIDVGLLNANRDPTTTSHPLYIDATCGATPGSHLDYSSIFDTPDEFTLSELLTNGSTIQIALDRPLAIAMTPSAQTGELVATEVRNQGNDGIDNDHDGVID